MAKLPEQNQGANFRRGVRQMVPADHSDRIQRNDPASSRAEQEFRGADREQLSSRPQTAHSRIVRSADPFMLCRAEERHADVRRFVGRCDAYGASVQHADRHCKYTQSVRHSGSEKDNYRTATQQTLHIRHFHRRRVQPSGEVGGIIGRRKSGQQHAFQSAIHIRRFRIGQNPHRTSDRQRNSSALSRIAGTVRRDEQISSPIPVRNDKQGDSRFHPFLSGSGCTDSRRHSGTVGQAGYAMRILQYLQPPANVGQTTGFGLRQAAGRVEGYRGAAAHALQVGFVGTDPAAGLPNQNKDHQSESGTAERRDSGGCRNLSGGEHLRQHSGDRRCHIIANRQHFIHGQAHNHNARQRDTESVCIFIPEGDNDRTHHRRSVRIYVDRQRASQLVGAHPRGRHRTPTGDVSGETTYQIAAYGDRKRDRRAQPCNGAAFLQNHIEPDRYRQGIPSAGRGDRETRTGVRYLWFNQIKDKHKSFSIYKTFVVLFIFYYK